MKETKGTETSDSWLPSVQSPWFENARMKTACSDIAVPDDADINQCGAFGPGLINPVRSHSSEFTAVPYALRAYEVEWKGREVIVNDPAANTTYEVGETMTVMVTKRPYPDHSKPYGLLDFQILLPSSTARVRRRQADKGSSRSA